MSVITVVVVASQAFLHSPLRDPRKLNLLLGLTALCFGLFFYSNGRKVLVDLAASPRHVERVGAHVPNAAEIYTGSFVVVPRSGSKCWRLLFDNRNGRTWGGHYFDCNAIIATNENQAGHKLTSPRMQAISAAFQR